MYYKNVKVVHSDFIGYTFPRLDKRYDLLTSIITDPDALDWEIEDAARKRREVRECINVFLEEGVEDVTVTVAQIIEVVTGQTIEALQKETPGGVLAQDFLEKTGLAARKTGEVTKRKMNDFANWLVSKTE